MQEAIKKIVEAEKKAAEIVASAQRKADEMISRNNSTISEKVNEFREKEYERYNKAVADAEKHNDDVLREIKSADSDFTVDIDSVSEQVVKRVMKTIFD